MLGNAELFQYGRFLEQIGTDEETVDYLMYIKPVFRMEEYLIF